MVKSSEEETVRTKSLTKAFFQGEEPKWGIYYNENQFELIGLDPQQDKVQILNPHNSNPREGSLWIMVREADGVYYPKAVQIKKFNLAEFNLSANSNNAIGQRLLNNFETISDPTKTDDERSKAKYDIESILYFPSTSRL